MIMTYFTFKRVTPLLWFARETSRNFDGTFAWGIGQKTVYKITISLNITKGKTKNLKSSQIFLLPIPFLIPSFYLILPQMNLTLPNRSL